MLLQGIKAITIEPYDVIVDSQRIWMETVRTVLEKYLYQIDIRIRTGLDAQVFYKYWQDKITEWKKEEFTGYLGLLGKTLSATFEDFGFTGDEKDINVLTDKWGKMPLLPEAESALSELKARYPLGIITEVEEALLRKTLDSIGMSFDVIVTSDTVRAFRPRPQLYLKAMELLQSKPQEVLHITASQEDLFGAKFVGMKTAFVSRAEQQAEGTKPDITITDMKALCQQLKQ